MCVLGLICVIKPGADSSIDSVRLFWRRFGAIFEAKFQKCRRYTAKKTASTPKNKLMDESAPDGMLETEVRLNFCYRYC